MGTNSIGYQYERVITAAREIPSQMQVLDLVKKHALDQTSHLFRPYLYRKAGVYAKQVLQTLDVKVTTDRLHILCVLTTC